MRTVLALCSLFTAACGGSLADPANVDAGGDPVDAAGAPGCPTALFKQVSPHPANSTLPDPVLDVRCEGDELLVESNGIPSFEYVMVSPRPIEVAAHAWRVPLAPVIAAEPTPLPGLGAVGFAIDGLPFYTPNEGVAPHPWGDPVKNNSVLDDCLGHVGGPGEYHYHSLMMSCLAAVTPAGEPSPVLGFAVDGFPIYGPLGCADAACGTVIELHSGYIEHEIADGSTYVWDAYEHVATGAAGELDECNGRVQPDGSYGYHLTDGFPYTIGCLRGTPTPEDLGAIGTAQSTVTIAETRRPACPVSGDCSGQCPAGRCECVELEVGPRCAMTCDSDADCPNQPGAALPLILRCGDHGLCVADVPAG